MSDYVLGTICFLGIIALVTIGILEILRNLKWKKERVKLKERIETQEKEDSEELVVEAKKVQEWIREKWGDKGCEMCGCKDWSISGEFSTPRPYSCRRDLNQQIKYCPQILLFCRNCANTKALLASYMGIVGSFDFGLREKLENE